MWKTFKLDQRRCARPRREGRDDADVEDNEGEGFVQRSREGRRAVGQQVFQFRREVWANSQFDPQNERGNPTIILPDLGDALEATLENFQERLLSTVDESLKEITSRTGRSFSAAGLTPIPRMAIAPKHPKLTGFPMRRSHELRERQVVSSVSISLNSLPIHHPEVDTTIHGPIGWREPTDALGLCRGGHRI